MAMLLSKTEYAIAMYQAIAGQQEVVKQVQEPEVIDVEFREIPNGYEAILHKEVLRLMAIARAAHQHLY